MEDERWLLRRLHASFIKESGLVGILEGRPTWSVNVSSTLHELRHFAKSLFPQDFLAEVDTIR